MGDPDRLSAHQVIADLQTEATSLARLGAFFQDAARTATERWLAQTVTGRGFPAAADDPEWPGLVTRARQAALVGNDLQLLLDDAITMRPIDDAHSVSAVLHWRLGVLTDHGQAAAETRGPLRSLPPIQTPEIDIARQTGELMRQRWRNIRTTLAASHGPLEAAPELGPRPADPTEASAWLTAATVIVAYRERYDVADHIPMLGPRPTATRPDAQAAWNYARLAADRYLAQRLRHLSTEQLEELDAHMGTASPIAPTSAPDS